MDFSSAGTTTRCESKWRLHYKHGDVIGSTQWLTDHNGVSDNPATTLAYTAFGEAVGDDSGAFSRYRYAGGHGYESDLLTLEGASGTDPITLLHVGERWYQPGIGRFLQRDPMGIAGWINVYVYAGNCPTVGIDPGGGTPSWLAPPQTATKIVYSGIVDGIGNWLGRTFPDAVIAITGGAGKTSVTRGVKNFFENKYLITPDNAGRFFRTLSGVALGSASGVMLVQIGSRTLTAWAVVSGLGWGGFIAFGGSTGNVEVDHYCSAFVLGTGVGLFSPMAPALIPKGLPAPFMMPYISPHGQRILDALKKIIWGCLEAGASPGDAVARDISVVFIVASTQPVRLASCA